MAPQLIITGDTTRPKVTGNQLVLSFDDTGNLDADAGHTPAPGAFTVLVNGVANAVTNVTVEPQAKTVTLTLATAVTHGQSVTVAYADPTTGNDANAIQDAAGNDATSFAATAVTNNTPAPADTTAPQLIITGDSRPKVTGNQLVLSFSDTGNLDADAAHTPAPGAFTVLVNGVANAVTNVTVDSQAKTVTLTLTTAVTSGQSVTVAYADPTTGNDANAIQDAAGNDATSFAATAVTNNTPDTTPPQLIITGDSRPKVTGNQLVLSFSDTGNLDADASHKPAPGAFTVLVNDVANAVTNVTVDSQAKTVTLTLTTAVTSDQSVTVAYADPTTGNDANAIQDAAGNDAASFAATAVTNNTPDTTPPQLIITGDSRPKVTGNQLVLSFSDTGNLDADAGHTPAPGAFTVLVNDVANAVTNVTVDSQAKTVTLTLTTAVTSDQSVTVAYADPTTGNDANAIQDAAGNDATSFAATAVTNNTPAPADTTAPQLIITGDARPKVNDNQLVLSYTDTSDLNGAALTGSAGFTVSSDAGTAITVSSAVVSATAKTVTLTLSRAVANGETVHVSYAKPAASNGVQDAAGNAAVDFSNQAVTNDTPDTTPPAINSAAVNGNHLVLTYTEANSLDGAALTGNAGFTVSGAAGAAITVSSAVVNATDKTVTLTLSRAVISSEIVRVSYAKPAASNGVRDVAGNAAVDFIDRAVTNTTPAADTTPPGLNTATVNGNQLVLTYAEANTLDEAALTGNAGFTVSSTAGAAITVSSAVVNGAAKTVTLTLSRAVASNETVTVNYAKPANSHGVQDAAGNAAVDFNDRAVTNNTPADTTAPEISTTTVTGDQLVLTYTEANSLNGAALTGNAGFTVESLTVDTGATTIPVNSAVVNGAAKTVTLTLSRAVVYGELVRVSYAKPATGNRVQDAAGNAAENFSDRDVVNDTRDTAAPQLITTGNDRPKITDGIYLVLHFSDASPSLDDSNGPAKEDFTVFVDGVAKTVTEVTMGGMSKAVLLTLSTSVESGQRVTVAYQDNTPGNNGIQDPTGNRLLSIPTTVVMNDTIAPQLITTGDTTRPKVNGNQLVLSFTDTSDLDADPTHTPANGAFTVLVNGVANAVTNVTVEPQAKTVTLTLTTAVTSGQSVTVAYDDPTTDDDANAMQDAAGNDAASFAATEVTNNTPAPADTTAPALITTGDSRPKVTGDQLVLSFSDTGNLDADASHKPAGGAFTVLVNGVANAVTNVTVDSQAKTVTLTLTTAVTSDQTVTVAYADPTTGNDANAIQDAAGNDAASFAATAVTNNTPAPADTTAPALIITGDSRPKVTGDQLVLSFSDTGNLDADATHKPAGGAFTVLVNGIANAVTNVTVEPQAKTVTLMLSTAVTSDQTVTVAYADPTTGNDANAIQDAAGNDAASFAATAVTNNTPAPADTTAPALIITGDSRPKVTGDQLVLSFSDTGNLDADASHKPASGAFTVLVNGVANAVTNVAINAEAKTVTLTLTTAVTSDQSVTVAYADPTTGNDANAIQDAAGNDAASFAATAVTNNTPAPADTAAPQLIITGDTTRPKVNGNQLVLSFSDTGNLDADPIHTPANGAFTVLVDSVANAVTNVAINAEAKTVTLTLTTAVTSDQTVTIAYADPTTGNDANAIQDAAGNDAASFAATAVTNNTPVPADTTAPALIITGDSRPKVTGNQLVLSFSDTGNLDADASHKPASGAFTVMVNGVANAVTNVTVDSQAKTVTLTLSTAVTSDQTVTVAYADPTTGNDANAIQDAAGNDAASFAATAVTNNTPAPADTTAPQLIITGDTTRPKVNGNQLVLSFSDTGNLDADPIHTPANGAFTVLVDSVANAVTNVAINAEAKTVTLTLSTAVTSDQTVTVAYADPTTGNDANAIQDAAGNDATSFAATAVTNNTPAPADTTAPALIITGDSRPKVTGDQLVLSFSDTGNLDADLAHKPANGAFTVLVNGVANAVTNVAIEPQAKTVTLTLTTAVTSDQTVTVAYADPTTGNDANAIQDAAGNDTASFAATAVTNNTPAAADATAPALIITGDSRPKVTGDQLVLSFSDTGNLDADAGHTPAPGAFTVLVNGVANAVTNVTVDSQAKTVTLTLTTAVTSDQTVTVAYADPTTG
ncbi:SwmB domain-containing protein, partial [Verminephrobacter aporrectodeae]|uniref:SwmB domain-containing protein n=9 Tax=Verminephrobacter aporrectodeae TaxID=1110389 RepID=UPI0022443BC2